MSQILIYVIVAALSYKICNISIPYVSNVKNTCNYLLYKMSCFRYIYVYIYKCFWQRQNRNIYIYFIKKFKQINRLRILEKPNYRKKSNTHAKSNTRATLILWALSSSTLFSMNRVTTLLNPYFFLLLQLHVIQCSQYQRVNVSLVYIILQLQPSIMSYPVLIIFPGFEQAIKACKCNIM